MSWIENIPYNKASGRLKTLYDRIRLPDGSIDHVMMVHSLRPHTMEGHMALYKNVLYHSGNKLPSWFLESIGAYVSVLNGCTYCTAHHFEGLIRLIKDHNRAISICGALAADDPAHAFDGRELLAMQYARALTVDPRSVGEQWIADLRKAGHSDGEILEINQVTAYFAYANRTVMGLGVTTRGEIVGASPNVSDDPEAWGHTMAEAVE
ncbi:MAG: peroxidase-related enzyme [Dongiaceae bacterium]